ncbi:alpha-glucan family phosphorylase [Aporhodopirellula aestuarii]|uniref:Alpha-glucan family phosphorylase n=1 Tax=Aporhodopirellula aestuarii TaxID=2950107 RepID=A0ABT0U0E7_9BACT|nr:alpha-glucan family phosphorylase [Aporhodopirellula aestuarii]MCM2370320.1 alpha-glucan family phosphorylase [Aporhodopirellula aestuarii]
MSENSPEVYLTNCLRPFDIEGFDALAELALDLRSSWNHATDEVWGRLDAELWDITHNPWVVLQTVSRQRIIDVLSDAGFRKDLDRLVSNRRRTAEQPAWFQQTFSASDRSASDPKIDTRRAAVANETEGDCPLTCAAYFSMEFMLSEALPIYSGGLGNVAGDQLKAASDLGVPVVAVGLLYQQGYFRQSIDTDGGQQALYPYNDPGQLPITPLRHSNGEWLRLRIDLPGYAVWLRAWEVQVGRVKLYLLDSNDAANFPVHRGITSELYGGDHDLRLKQELVLGIGGWRLLCELGLTPEVCHLNEGHAAFAVLERARVFMEQSGQPFEVALAVTRAGNLFTTHTAVPAGFDRFSPDLIEQYLGRYAQVRLGISTDDLLALGRQNPHDHSEPFNMAYLAIRGSGAVNGVSRLHGQVSRRMFEPLFRHWPEDDVPIGHVTNGVHMPSWDSEAADKLWTRSCGKDRWLGTSDSLPCDICRVSDEELWQFRVDATHSLVEYSRRRLSRELAASGVSPEDVEAAKHLFDPNTLTLGFARRFATYKRPNLLLHDPDRLLRLLADSERPVQLVIAGKAHPADQAGQDLIRRWIEFIRDPLARQHVIFLSDYDMLLAEQLVQGVDVWVNTPQRPWEASGTSGMKVLVNGGINLSELDGWWAEAYTPEVGWAIGDGQEHRYDPGWDAIEAEQLYHVLENEVVPEFYERNERGLPTRWLARMRASMSQLTPQFSAIRSVRQYTEQYYLPAATAYRERVAYNGARGTSIVNWEHSLREKWPSLEFGEVRVETREDQHSFETDVYLDGLDPHYVSVELYAEASDDEPSIQLPMSQKDIPSDLSPGENWATYFASVAATRPASDFTPRIVPKQDKVAVPLELDLIRWQR